MRGSFAVIQKAISIVLSAGLLVACTSQNKASDAASTQWISIFDGESLSGWTPKINGHALGEDPAQIFRVENGELHVTYEDMAEFDNAFGHLFLDEELANYRLRFEYRFLDAQKPGGPPWAYMNSGVMVHAQAPTTLRQDQAFPVSLEAQLLGTSEQTPGRTTANICTPGTHIVLDGTLTKQHCVTSQTPAAAAGTWVSFEVEVRGSTRTRLMIDDTEAFVFTEPQFDTTDPDVVRLGLQGPVNQGYIALQAESHPVAFRNIELMRLD